MASKKSRDLLVTAAVAAVVVIAMSRYGPMKKA